MSSLAQHLLADDHDGLSFRSDCARCRARLSGRLPEPSLLSHRQQATLATGLVSAGALLPLGPPSPATPQLTPTTRRRSSSRRRAATASPATTRLPVLTPRAPASRPVRTQGRRPRQSR